MNPRFTPCPSCARHVKQSASTCPFCGEQVPHGNVPAARVAVGRLSRSAILAAGAAGLALVTTKCSSPAVLPPYGGPPMPLIDAASEHASVDAADASSTPDAATDAGSTEDGSVRPLDGAGVPPTDSGEGGD